MYVDGTVYMLTTLIKKELDLTYLVVFSITSLAQNKYEIGLLADLMLGHIIMCG